MSWEEEEKEKGMTRRDWVRFGMAAGALGALGGLGGLVTGQLLPRSEEHTSELQSQSNLVCRLLLEKKKKKTHISMHGVICSCYTHTRVASVCSYSIHLPAT